MFTQRGWNDLYKLIFKVHWRLFYCSTRRSLSFHFTKSSKSFCLHETGQIKAFQQDLIVSALCLLWLCVSFLCEMLVRRCLNNDCWAFLNAESDRKCNSLSRSWLSMLLQTIIITRKLRLTFEGRNLWFKCSVLHFSVFVGRWIGEGDEGPENFPDLWGHQWHPETLRGPQWLPGNMRPLCCVMFLRLHCGGKYRCSVERKCFLLAVWNSSPSYVRQTMLQLLVALETGVQKETSSFILKGQYTLTSNNSMLTLRCLSTTMQHKTSTMFTVWFGPENTEVHLRKASLNLVDSSQLICSLI